MSNIEQKKVLIALDYDNESAALAFVSQLSPDECRLKVGKEMFTYFGPQFVKKLVDLGFDVFLDLKFHDIPNTVAKAVTAAAELGVWMVNVHASGGTEMMSKAKEALSQYGDKAPLLIAVTVLTSMDQAQLSKLGIDKTPQEQVLYLAKLAKESGLDGVVCSAQEAETLKVQLGNDFKLITPGIRPAGSDAGDQKRIMTPAKAIQAGSDYLVIGRPITKAEDPAQALRDINASIA
ncbi:orotidine-5'-phosphate decarboxylase [Pseudoalteromonas luteoviolacea]|uniref:Orotidine 5'-phosphate decarboxylase n=1 Tax=Pseudoalteromonas luteoviolacea S4054 TaxID=1129367 RepID=A0A0F6ADZ7_9GAMM|nr:orotidine-5'-phosphate decarboxylase [Pseudoalteromonas luteoviolacea]AOT08072.1 orotidine 5'-phosphate decarboxylase [Pseudoalteromonas luteoviolacea]AOT12989.1 orotidine 5'-phosphate decarboxylase [Pseudoalteromonas luteoviolacea]AOT17901.1 orotidine 5'-phosphate decarboxylase [Pseudoalteromonas luteoviolacea]KKE84378.1 orotidine 5'-phosphate decarboxylase [Pseudoalteromonas luteoviolacea S4054]KZN71753.1 orotidine 5'-phosphate decarboxylase [Pseudoalteromonas luteoviolacea S4047-1]